MPAAAWLMNMGFAAGGAVVVVPPDVPGLEFTAPDHRLGFRAPRHKLDFTAPASLEGFRAGDEDQ